MLTQSHRESLGRDGYAVISGLLPANLLGTAADVITAFVNADLNRPETWYRHDPLEWSIVPIHQAQAFWDGAVLCKAAELYAANERELHFCDLDADLAIKHPPLVQGYASCGLVVHQDFRVP